MLTVTERKGLKLQWKYVAHLCRCLNRLAVVTTTGRVATVIIFSTVHRNNTGRFAAHADQWSRSGKTPETAILSALTPKP